MGKLERIGLAADNSAPGQSSHPYLSIMHRVMKNQKITHRHLAKIGIISDRGRKTLDHRIACGTISVGEYDRINAYLKIDPIQLHMALNVYNDPDSYFEQSTEMAASVSHEVGLCLRENQAAKEGDFGPISGNLVRAHAERLSAEFTKQMSRIDRFREAPLA